MSTKQWMGSLIMVGTASLAFAEGPVDYPVPQDRAPAASASTLTRAEVLAEYFASLEPQAEPEPSRLTREAVIAEYFRARDAGEMSLHGEDSGSFWLAANGWRPEEAIRVAQLRLLARRD
ncbi:MAG: hypothetical protein LC125_07050 [Burkholderiales bacterium]|nr:hypothetical protein [Burkholderiales bacterium]